MAGVFDLSSLKKDPQPSQGGGAHEILVTAANVQQVLVSSQEKPVILQVGSSRSPESDEMRKNFNELHNDGFTYAYVDADATPEVAGALGVQAIPTVVAFIGGRPAGSFQGGQPRQVLEQLVSQVAPGEEKPSDPRIDNANALLESGNVAEAEAAFQKILKEEPGNKEAKSGLARTHLIHRVAEAQVDAATGLDAELIQADAEAAGGDLSAAFSRLLGQLMTNFGDDKETVKKRLIELFSAFEGSPEVDDARRKMASALF
ncbi:MAG: tetratricopeptide repeat protein [Corynebacterium pyruviciproducens]|uniref:tetratricopeptide repeat protein n=1 Tax=Corynebacterium pyruviciproducens TaxID=598660 RepID=UPI003982E262